MTSYKDSGVNVEEGNEFVKNMGSLVRSTYRPNVLSHIGGFSGLYDVSFLKEYKKPVLVASTDGVGTKIEIARELGKLDTIGIDLVAMVVNDILVQGAEPMFFLDYYATGKLNKEEAIEIVKGIVVGCKQARCSLIGGETAEMPGVYEGGKFDLAGCGVGWAEKDELLPNKNSIKKYDVIVGIPSSGIHSNGFSLVRRLISDGLLPLSEDLLTPTKIYANDCMQTKHLVKAFAHITGEGITGNVPRVLPPKLEPVYFTWDLPHPFDLLKDCSKLSNEGMMETFNCGIGMVAIMDPSNIKKFRSFVPDAIIIGELREKNNNEQTISSNSGI